MIFEIVKFFILSGFIVVISKNLLVIVLRKLAENMNLNSKVVGNITGIATSTPELLTVSFSAYAGLIEASSYNILSSNIINLIQYLIAIYLNKNQKVLLNKALKIDLILVIFTILIPIFISVMNINYDITIVPLFIILAIFFYYLNNNCHKLYLTKQKQIIENEIKQNIEVKKGKIILNIFYIMSLVFIGILLFVIGNELTNTLTALCNKWKIPEIILGILLGIVTSIPELITFLESQKFYNKDDYIENELGVIESTNNLLTSNIINLFIVQTLGIIIFTLRFL